MRPLALTLSMAAAFACPISSAALQSIGGPFGPDSITVDPGVGLEWLDLTITAGQSWNDVGLRLQAGGDLVGWRFAERWDLEALTGSAGATLPAFLPTIVNGPPIVDLIALVGATFSNSAGSMACGVLGEQSGQIGGSTGESRFVGCLAHTPPFGQLDTSTTTQQQFARSSISGAWLVRSVSAVPEPDSALVATLGLAVVAMRLKASRSRRPTRGGC